MESSEQRCRNLLARLEKTLAGRPMRFMEVCGTHTVALFRSGLRALLPPNLTHLSGPGCPVCVTHDSEIAAFLDIALEKDVCLATFGDLLRVPGPGGRSLKHAKAEGAHIEIVYSPLDALRLAKRFPKELVCFLGIGFETTAPAVAATILQAAAQGLENFCVFSLHKCVPPVLRALLDDPDTDIDAFLLPGHVSTILGLAPYAFLAKTYGKSGVVGGFEPEEILEALCAMAELFSTARAEIQNAYPRGVRAEGNPKARELLAQVFVPVDARWRGLGGIQASGLGIREDYAHFDAVARLGITLSECAPPKGCRCGDVLKGTITPKACPLFGSACTPREPIGPCMVSTEGSCAAWFTYGGTYVR